MMLKWSHATDTTNMDQVVLFFTVLTLKVLPYHYIFSTECYAA